MLAVRTILGGFFLMLASCSGVDPDLKSPDPYARYLGVRNLEFYPDKDSIAEIVRLLDDPKEHYLVHTGALEALAAIGRPQFIQHVAPRTRHDHPMVRQYACAALGAIRNPEGIVALREASQKDADPAVRRAAVKALATFGKISESLKALAEAVGDRDPGVSMMAHDSLRGVTGREDVPRERAAWEKAVQ